MFEASLLTECVPSLGQLFSWCLELISWASLGLGLYRHLEKQSNARQKLGSGLASSYITMLRA